MSTIVLNVPDELAARLDPVRDQLPQLLALALDLLPGKAMPDTAAVYPVYREMIDFLVSGPTRPQIIDYKVSAGSQRRLGRLLDKNRAGTLTAEEQAELDAFSQVNHILVLLKARARSAGSFA